jgi:hypothetical protein
MNQNNLDRHYVTFNLLVPQQGFTSAGTFIGRTLADRKFPRGQSRIKTPLFVPKGLRVDVLRTEVSVVPWSTTDWSIGKEA